MCATFACCPPQDGDAEPVAAVAQALAPAFLRSARGFEFWQKTPRVAALSEKQAGHAWLAQHYKWVQGRAGWELRCWLRRHTICQISAIACAEGM